MRALQDIPEGTFICEYGILLRSLKAHILVLNFFPKGPLIICGVYVPNVVQLMCFHHLPTAIELSKLFLLLLLKTSAPVSCPILCFIQKAEEVDISKCIDSYNQQNNRFNSLVLNLEDSLLAL